MTGPTPTSERITSLDAIRGVAVLGILMMNAVSYARDDAVYSNIGASSPQTALDWAVGAVGEVLFDQKFMGLFSMLFGAGIVLFADRVAARGGRPVAVSLWRNTLLLAIGLLHSLLWAGDILTVYAVCSPILLMMRHRSDRALAATGTILVLSSAVWAIAAQTTVDGAGSGLSTYWGVAGEYSDPVGLWLLGDYFLRALGMMLLGIAAHRSGFLTGAWNMPTYRRIAVIGLGVGIPLATAGFAWVALEGFDPSVAIAGAAPNTVATIPMVLGYVSLVVLWHRRRAGTRLDHAVRATGRMALTNYLSQTVLGVVTFEVVLATSTVSRTGILGFVVMVWVIQLAWSTAWLARHRYGPAEWVWRAATYRSIPGGGRRRPDLQADLT